MIYSSKIGFGTWAIGGDSYGITDDLESLKSLSFSFKSGINFFDTADLYGKGHSEYLLGKIFSKNRHEIIVASKVGYCLNNPAIQNFNKGYIIRSLDSTLKRLNTDYLDIYYLHSPQKQIIIEGEAFNTLAELKKKGKIKNIGISVRTVDDGLLALNKFDFDSIQFIYNLLDQRARENGLLDLAVRKNIFTVARVPLCFGFLTCKYPINTRFSSGDQRSRWSLEQRNSWIYTSNLFKELFENYNFHGMDSLSLKFCLSTKGISTVIPGMKTIEQVKKNLKSLSVNDFSEELMSEIYNLYSLNKCIPNVK